MMPLPRCHTAPAHPHATDAVVYTALFFIWVMKSPPRVMISTATLGTSAYTPQGKFLNLTTLSKKSSINESGDHQKLILKNTILRQII